MSAAATMMASPVDGERDSLLRSVQTYIAGEDAGRMASAARALGLSDGGGRRRRRVVRSLAPFWNDTTLTAARMHSVGTLGPNERIDGSGTLTIRSRRRRTRDLAGQPSYGSLRNLFHAPTAEEGLDHHKGDVMEFSSDEDLDEDSPEMVAGGSLSAAVFGIVKGTVGPAILYLPHGLQTSGYGVAVPSMLLATGLYLYASHCLLSCWRVEHERQHQIAARLLDMQKLLLEKSDTDGDAADNETMNNYTPKLLTYPELARRALPNYSILVDMGIASMQYGVCLTYLIFVPANLVACTQGRLLSKTGFLVLMTLLEIPLSWISDIRKLTTTNVVATLLILYGLTSVLLMAVWEGMKRIEQDEATSSWVWLANAQTLPAFTETWFLFVGTSFFMMEGSITLLVPLQEAVYLPEDRQSFPRVNQQVTSSIVVAYIVFALVCVLGLSRPGGGHLPTALTASLPQTAIGWWAPSIQAAYAAAVLLTFPLQAFPATQVASRLIFGPGDTSKATAGDVDGVDATKTKPWFGRQQVLSTVVTIGLGIIAYVAIDYLGNVVSILGSLFGIPLALVFPPLMHNSLVLDSTSKSRSQNAAVSDTAKTRNVTVARITNYVVVCMGLCAMMAASMATIVSWDEGAET